MYRITQNKIGEQVVSLPSSKSVSHRICLLGSLNHGKTSIKNLLQAEDTDITLNGLTNMGMNIERKEELLICKAPIGNVQQDKIYLGNSGSSARFLLPLAVYLDKPMQFFGDPRLHQRPFSGLFSALKQLGVSFDSIQDSLPVYVFPGEVPGGRICLSNLPTSQFITALMIAALWMKNDLFIELPDAIPSWPYVDMTYKLMKHLGLNVELSEKQIWVEAKKPNFDWHFSVEKDLSAAAYWVVFALIHGVKITLPGIQLPSLQGDEQIFAIAEQCGGKVMLFPDRVEISGRINKGFTIKCVNIPDLVPALSILALFAPEPVKLMGIENLQFKESNRIAAIQQNLAVIGGKSDFKNGRLTIFPQKKYSGGLIKTFNDHRIAMSFAIAGSRITGISIDNAQCVNKSYPEFWNDFSFWERQG